MQRKLYFQELHTGIYRSCILLFCGPQHLMNRKLKSLGQIEIEESRKYQAYCSRGHGGECHVFWCPDLEVSSMTIVHEAVHLAHYILDTRGMKLTDETQEAYCYLVEYIYEEIANFIKNAETH